MKPGDRVIWLYSKKRSFVTGWRLQRIPGVVIRVCKQRIRLKVQMPDTEKVLNVRPENVISEDE
jgi:hypothetical protein